MGVRGADRVVEPGTSVLDRAHTRRKRCKDVLSLHKRDFRVSRVGGTTPPSLVMTTVSTLSLPQNGPSRKVSHGELDPPENALTTLNTT